MENLDFNGVSDIIRKIEPEEDRSSTDVIIEEKKVAEPQMMEFSSSIADLMPVAPSSSQDVYTNPTNNRVTGLSLPNEPPAPAKKSTGNPFNLTDDQFNASIAGIVAVIVFSNTVQMKLSSMVPNFSGINGSIASALLAAVIFFFAHRFIKNR